VFVIRLLWKAPRLLPVSLTLSAFNAVEALNGKPVHPWFIFSETARWSRAAGAVSNQDPVAVGSLRLLVISLKVRECYWWSVVGNVLRRRDVGFCVFVRVGGS
jgi:hypothetical protein